MPIKKVLLFVIAIVSISLLVITVSYRYFSSCIKPTVSSDDVLINTLKLEAPSYMNSFLIGDFVNITIQNTSENSVYIPKIREYSVYELDACGNIQGSVDLDVDGYSRDFVLTPAGSEESFAADNLAPQINSEDEGFRIGIFMFGYVFRNGEITDEKVGGYIEVNLYLDKVR